MRCVILCCWAWINYFQSIKTAFALILNKQTLYCSYKASEYLVNEEFRLGSAQIDFRIAVMCIEMIGHAICMDDQLCMVS